VFHKALHPYTIGLLNSVPVFGRKGKRVLVPIKGIVPTPTEEIVGCAFAPRCAQAKDVCAVREPHLVTVEPGHQVACFV
jgi:oligopeptide/dipeptide ABC transporter ATP-binding protein